jgi:hypothetical protein
MARVNWSRAAKERQIREKGHESISPEDTTLRGGRLPFKPDPPPKGNPAHRRAEELRKQQERIAQVDKGERRKQERMERRRAELERRKAAAEKRRAKAEAWAALSPEQQAAPYARVAEKLDVRKRGVIVETRPLSGRARKTNGGGNGSRT